ncbi:hypothetical protein ACFLTT_00150 [Chloroflexota bacterium]
MISNTIPSNNSASIAHCERLAELLMELYFVPGSYYYEGPLYVSHKRYRHIKKAITTEHVLSHIRGEISIGAPSNFKEQTKWITLDSDSPDQHLLSQVQSLLKEKTIPSYISFSGKKGYHLTIFLKSATPLHIAQTLSGELKRSADYIGLKYDKISPSLHGKGGDCIKLPIGLHPETGDRCYFLDENLQPVKDALIYVKEIQKVDLDNVGISETTRSGVNPETGEILHSLFPKIISQRACINKLWNDGLQASHTRHSATCAIANTLMRSTQIDISDREVALVEWITKIHPKASTNGITKSDLKHAVSEAKRQLQRYSMYGSHAELCENIVFKAAMRSACDNEFECKLRQNHGHVNFKLLLKLGIFNAQNAKPKGIGKSAMAIYWATEDIAQDFQQFEYNGMPAFSLSTQQLIGLANCSNRTVITHKKRLIRLGLLRRVPVDDVPRECYEGRPKYVRESFHALPLLSEDNVRNALMRLRGG